MTSLTSAGSCDIFTAKLDPAGNWLWANRAGGDSDDFARGIAVDSAGNCSLTGNFRTTADFGPYPLLTRYWQYAGWEDVFVARLDAAGNWLWVKSAGDVYQDFGEGVALDAAGNTYITGQFCGTADFGPFILTDAEGFDYFDLFVAKLDPAGNWLWAMRGGGDDDESGLDIALDGEGGIMITGWYWGHTVFDSFPIMDGSSGVDAFVAKLQSDEGNVPVELSSFSATATADNLVRLAWATQSETAMLGYRVYRSIDQDQSTALQLTDTLIPATNTSSSHSYGYTDAEVSIGSTYYYWLEGVEFNSSEFFGPVSVTLDANVPPAWPELTALQSAYPNPFKASANTNIRVSLKESESGTLTIYDIRGQIVRTFALNQGPNTVSWNGRDAQGRLCGSGIYFYRLNTPSLSQTRKVVIIK